MELYFQLMIDKFIYTIIILGALNWGLIGMFKFNLVTFALSFFTPVYQLNRVIYVIIGLVALLKLYNRDYYLPFLGNAVFPCDSLQVKTPANPTLATKIKTKPNVNVVYWASEGTNDIVVRNPWKAYDKYNNAGVALSDAEGYAVLKVRQPVPYKIPTGFTLKPHIHYRICLGNGMLSPIKTVFLK